MSLETGWLSLFPSTYPKRTGLFLGRCGSAHISGVLRPASSLRESAHAYLVSHRGTQPNTATSPHESSSPDTAHLPFTLTHLPPTIIYLDLLYPRNNRLTHRRLLLRTCTFSPLPSKNKKGQNSSVQFASPPPLAPSVISTPPSGSPDLNQGIAQICRFPTTPPDTVPRYQQPLAISSL